MSKSTRQQINVEVVDNPVASPDGNQKMFRPLRIYTLDSEGVINEIMRRRPGYQIETVRSIYQMSMRVLEELLVSGANIRTELFNASVKTRGAAVNGQWDKEKNSLYIQFTQSSRLRKALSDSFVKVTGNGRKAMVFVEGYDTYTQEKGFTATITQCFILRGRFIKLAGDHPDVGITLTASDGTVTRIPANAIINNMHTTLSFLLPGELQPGEYVLTVTTQYSSSRMLKRPRSVSHPICLVQPVPASQQQIR